MTKRTTVLVADDHPIYREGIARAIRERPELELVGEAADGREAANAIGASEPDVALLDLQLPEMSGIEVTETIKARGLATQVVILSAFAESELVYKAIAAGARGYLRKDATRAEICEAITAVARGDGVVPAAMQGDLLSEIQRKRERDRPVLTAREQEVLTLTAEGARRTRDCGASLSELDHGEDTLAERLQEARGLRSRGGGGGGNAARPAELTVTHPRREARSARVSPRQVCFRG
jgi:two-component system, NarL family, nitrate/nitrite response regulator NarL